MVIATATDRLQVAREAEERIGRATSIDELRQAFQDYYGHLGWKVLCRMFVLHQTPAEALRLQNSNGRE